MKTIVTFLLLAGATLSAFAETPEWMTTGEIRWKSSPPLIGPRDDGPVPDVALKDPTMVQVDGVWHLIATHRMADKTVAMQQISFTDWSEAGDATRHSLNLHDQYHCAPQVFYYRPHRKWYLIYQLADESKKIKFGPYFSTTETLADPTSWSKPRQMIEEVTEVLPEGRTWPKWIDFWVICDEEKAHLFNTSDDGNFWRRETTREDFPFGWSEPQLVLGLTREELYEASCTYKLKGMNKYLTIIEAIGDRGRYYKAWLADQLEGPWEALGDTEETAFATVDNVVQEVDWTRSISHGEMIRSGYDEFLEIDPMNLRLVYQGANQEEYKGNRYGSIPWRIAVLEQITSEK